MIPFSYRTTLAACLVGLIVIQPLAAQAQEGEVAAAVSLSAQADEEIVLPALRQLDVVGDESLPPATPADGGLVRREVPPTLQSAAFAEIGQSMIGHPVSRESLRRLQRTVRLALAAEGYPFSLVYLPEQDITDGRLRLVVRESRIGEIEVEGNRYFPAEVYRRHLNLKSGGAIDRNQFDPALAAISLGGYRDATIKVRRGTTPGTSDIVIVTRERKPWSIYGGFNNSGTLSTDELRLTGGASWGYLRNGTHTVSANWASDPRARYSRSLSGSYAAALAPGHTVTVLAAYSELRAKVAAPLDQAGTNWQVGLNYDHDLGRVGDRFVHNLQVGFDFKSSDNNLDYILPPIIFPVSGNLTEIVQTRVRYTGRLNDDWGTTRGSVQVVGAPGGLAGANHDADFQGTRAGATADYVYARVDLSRDFALRGELKGWRWSLRGAGQFSNANLLGSEQFSAGGGALGRGYHESSILGDNALSFSQELYLPAMPVWSRLGNDTLRDQLQVFGFQDYAETWNTDPLPGEHGYDLHSVGVGLRYQLSTHFTASLSHGWQLKDLRNVPLGDGHRFHFSLSASY